MVLEGTLTCEEGPSELGGKITRHTMNPGEVFHITPGTIHRFCAKKNNVRLVEVSTPEISDVVRLEDDYRRIKEIPEPPRASEK